VESTSRQADEGLGRDSFDVENLALQKVGGPGEARITRRLVLR
jgi:hypothetical protein